AKDRMCAWGALFDPTDMQRASPEVHLIPAQVRQFRRPQAVPVGYQGHGGVPAPPTVLPRRVHQPLDLGLGQVLAGAQLAVRGPLRGNCSVYGGWRDQRQMPFGHGLRASCANNDPPAVLTFLTIRSL